MASAIQLRRDLSGIWTSTNPVLNEGQQGYETDTGKMKIGDGVTVWTLLDYFVGDVGVVDHGALTGLADDDHTQYHTDARGDLRYSQLAHDHAGTYEPADGTILKDADIGVNVEAYDATILKDADIGVTVQAYDATNLVDGDIGVTVEAYDATILKDADIGVTVEAYDATILKDADIGVTVASKAQGDLADTALQDITAEPLTDLVDIPTIVGEAGKLLKVNGTADGYVWGDPSGTSVSWGDITGTLSSQTDLQLELDGKEAADATILKDADIGVNVQAYDAAIQTHLSADTKHRLINDVGTLTTELFSASKIISDLSDKSDTSHNHTGTYEPADATILKDADIGVTVQAYDSTILVDGDIGTTVQAYDATILVDADIGVNVQGYDLNTVVDPVYVHTDLNFTALLKADYDAASVHSGTAHAPANADNTASNETSHVDVLVDADVGVSVQAYDATILKDADIGVSVQAYDATYLVDADIGSTVQAYDLTNALKADVTFETLDTNGDVGGSAGTLAAGNHTHDGVYEPVDATLLRDADIGVNVQAYDATILVDADIGVNVQAYDPTILKDADKGVANGVASLDATAKIPNAQLPALAITSPHAVASEVAQLALTVQEGDVAIRSDLNKSYIAVNDVNASMADWLELLTPTDAVLSVDGNVGAVDLTSSYEPKDITILKDADIGVSVQAHDATLLNDADIGVNVQAYDATTLTGASSIDNLNDVTIGTEALGDILQWDGTTWENNDNFYRAVALMNGTAETTAVIAVTSNGTVVTVDVSGSAVPGTPFEVFIDQVQLTYPGTSISLTVGTDISPVRNYVYILDVAGTATLTVSTTGWPNVGDYVAIADIIVQSALSVQNDGPYKVHAWTDHVKNDQSHGHLADINAWIRRQHATWQNGVASAVTIDTGVTPNTVDVSTGAGEVIQVHDHTFPAMDTAVTDEMYVVNSPVAAFNRITDLNELTVDALNVSYSGRSMNLIIWGVISETTGDCKLMINLPTASYASQLDDNAIDDTDNTAVYALPSDFVGTGFLIARLTLKNSGLSTYTNLNLEDLRGSVPNAAAGAAGGGGSVTDHSLLSNLLADDHPQYHTDVRGDARYSLLAHNHTGVYEPVDATILRDSDIGVNVEAYDATILKDADIGVTVAAQVHNHNELYAQKTLLSTTQTGTAYTLVLTDVGKNVTMNNAGANTLTIPANASVAFPIGTQILISQLGAGQTTVAITTDTLNRNADFTLKLAGQYSEAVITKKTSDMWIISGDLEVV